MGPLEEVNRATLLALIVVFFWAIRKCRKRNPEEEQRAVAAENRRKARRPYKEAFGAGDFSVIAGVVAEGFFDHLGRRHGPEGSRVLSQVFAAPSLTCASPLRSGACRVTRHDPLHAAWHEQGGVLWYPPTNQRAVFAASYTDRFLGGMLVEHRGEPDMADLLEQRGLPPRDA